MKLKLIGEVVGATTWGCMTKRYSFVVAKLNEVENEYTASWLDTSVSTTEIVRIDGKFTSLQQAEAACRRTLKELNNKH